MFWYGVYFIVRRRSQQESAGIIYNLQNYSKGIHEQDDYYIFTLWAHTGNY